MGRLRARTLIAGMVVLATVGITPTATATATTGIADQWSKPGPFEVTVEALDDTHTVYRPSRLEKHPVILWGNGTGANPGIYDGLLRHLASHGFVVAATDTPNAGSGKEILAGATTLIAENSRPGSRYQGKIDTAHIGATGHSQGGGGAIAAGADPRVTTTIPIEPGPQGSATALKGPSFFLGGQFDIIVVPALLVIPRYRLATQVPAIYGELAGATHFTPTGDGGGFRGAVTAWFRFWLSGDERARAEFFGPSCGLCRDGAWSDVQRNAKALAVPAA
ncbi:acetylxylan esterase [Amycolatopsis coloradensis]|uniref:Acetylxylan esterase n=1 Tax=Amycolatopsis coloradensis TaxID=76021 RepID=A0A1R0L2B2_9PSEU|nr:acetylxylan esterase [Amycolatopsis coloradensis]OLZ56493.1 acetylxylan esterase [Amycolatopsis coloradensis]